MKLNDSHILIVDDNPKNIQLLGSVLKENGYSVEYALNGNDALQLVEDRDFDLVLLDVMMPEMDGFKVCKYLKKDNATKDIPIIFLTSQTESESIVRGFELGAVDYISKPFGRDELLSRVSTHVTLRRAQKELAVKNKLLTDSIQYAKRIQISMLPEKDYLSESLMEYFLFYQPKDIVSGDFLWIRKLDHQIVLAVADGTGHGVPGAFMSMLGISLLNEIVPKSKPDNPGKILDQMREGVKRALQQSGRADEAKDGMDIALCIYNTDTLDLQFSGAFNPIYIIRQRKLMELKGDRQPVAIHSHEHAFTSHQFKLQKGDSIYLFSDGYADQYGGKTDKKFLIKNFKELLVQVSEFNMDKQHLIIRDKFKEWKGDQAQIDDVIIVGFRI